VSLLGQIYATPSRVKAVLQLLARERGGRLKQESLEQLLSPGSLVRNAEDDEERKMAHSVIAECERLQLVQMDGDFIALDPHLSEKGRDLDSIRAALPDAILDRIVDPRSDNPNSDLAAALAWYLGQDALRAPGLWKEFGDALIDQNANDVLRFNDNRFFMFLYWARYLGLANILGIRGEERLAPDPTRCMRRIVRSEFGEDGKSYPIREFMLRVKERCPVFEGGAIREAMDRHSPRREPKYLSSTTSHALLRMEEERMLGLEMLSDADALLLTGDSAPRAVSQIRVLKQLEGL
jgi:hypothetical protein